MLEKNYRCNQEEIEKTIGEEMAPSISEIEE